MPLFVLLSDGAPDEDVVHMADHSIKALQDVGHTSLEVFWCRADSKR